MKILIYSDNHWATSTSVFRQRGKRYSKKLENQIESIDWINELAVDRGCERIICLGDFFDKPELNAEELTALREIDVTKHEFIVGNHEITYGNLQYSSAHLFSNFSKVYDKITTFEIGNTQFLVIPYITEDERVEISQLIEANNLDTERLIILSHNDIKNIQYGYYKSTTGFPKEDIVKSCKLFINGHIHNPGTFEEKIVNVGSLTGINFNNDNDNYSNGVIILDTNTMTYERVINPHGIKFYKTDLKSVEDAEEYISKRADGRAIFSIKVPERLSDQIDEIFKKYEDEIVYKKLTIVYSIKKDTESSDVINLNVNYYDKFRQFVKDKFNDGTVNLALMLEELDIIGGE